MKALRVVLFSGCAVALICQTHRWHAGPTFEGGNVLLTAQVMCWWYIELFLFALVFGICVSSAGSALVQLLKGEESLPTHGSHRRIYPESED